MSEVVTLRCAECGLPFLELEDGQLHIVSRHHGRRHANTVAVSDLVRLAASAPAENVAAATERAAANP